jgi:hypothetical protein
MTDGHNVVLDGHPYQLEWSNVDNDGVTPFSGCVISSRVTQKWGDFDCNGVANPVDSLKGLQAVAGIQVIRIVPGCPDFGSSVMVNGVTLKWGTETATTP